MDRFRPILTRCRCGVTLTQKDRVLHCDYLADCPRRHEFNPVLFEKLKAQANGDLRKEA